MQAERVRAEFHFAQKQSKARHHETETHEGQAGANPGEKGTFRGKVNTRIGGRRGTRGN
jgi:hypothetical protein